ncbi:MAG: hypothetical protein GTO55_11345 [Armatimonadetes bacterium]|nr:hypothetical protein [Armatimonadota bacterium]NIM24811.1 hypothetical protein [Armatimonadota bacterium]NIM68702.1 hypothetical protein [Armatimonadota bacterium]NIM76997.1 hypothetical protein [Armatimonadota bacterium]NIN06902.1 hypothetical protein [Armatimonadota bacterium]
MRNTSFHLGGDFFSQLAARDPLSRRLRRLFERGVIVSVFEDSATVCVGSREDSSDILLEDVPIVSGYNPQVGDWVSLHYDGGHGGAPMVFGPSVSDETEETPSTSSPEVIAARDSVRHGSHSSLDARLEDHEQDSTDPHGSILEQTTKLRAPLIDSATAVKIHPLDHATCARGEADNLIRNPDFEADIDGDGVPDYWTLDTGVTRTVTNAHKGKHALELAKSDSAVYALTPDPIPVDTDLVYEIRAEWLTDSANDGQAKALMLAITCFDDNGSYLGYSRLELSGTTTRTRSLYRLTAEQTQNGTTYRFYTGTRFVKVKLWNHGANNSKTYVSWVEFKPVYHWGGKGVAGTSPPAAVIADKCIRSEDRVQVTGRDESGWGWAHNIQNLTQFTVTMNAIQKKFSYEVFRAVE